MQLSTDLFVQKSLFNFVNIWHKNKMYEYSVPNNLLIIFIDISTPFSWLDGQLPKWLWN